MWTATSGQINKWRRKTLKIGNTDMGHLAQSKITFIYNFSPVSVLNLFADVFTHMIRLLYQNLWTGAIPQSSLDSKLNLHVRRFDLNPSRSSWFLDNPDLNWTPPPSLIQWMDKAREDGKAIVYIGFGSITVPNSRSVTERIIKAVLKST